MLIKTSVISRILFKRMQRDQSRRLNHGRRAQRKKQILKKCYTSDFQDGL